jgi:aryl-alcohol dehydrogenase-like predicted oxidoreductase
MPLIRRIQLGRTGIDASCLGFGCASLGSRIAETQALRSIEAAYAEGVTWFDLAPAYGRGNAEKIARLFLAGRSDPIQLATKVGLVAPKRNALTQVIIPLARRSVGVFPSLRHLSRAIGVGVNRRLELTPDLINSSLEASLLRLGVEQIELYALHNASASDLRRTDILRALEDLLATGRVRAVAVAGDIEAARAALEVGYPFGIVQLGVPLMGEDTSIIRVAEDKGFGIILHSIFGLDALRPIRSGDSKLIDELTSAIGSNCLTSALNRLRLARAFALAPSALVLASMFSNRSLQENVAVARQPKSALSLAEIELLISSILRYQKI